MLLLTGCDCGRTSLEGDSGGDQQIDGHEAQELDSFEQDEFVDGDICGNLVLEPHEACDTNEILECLTSCGSLGGKRCIDCQWSDCIAPAEECNGIDDDCDGLCDNGFECCEGDGEVECTNEAGIRGIKYCNETCSWSSCCAPAEVCQNGYDDDCDGSIDEPVKLGGDVRVTNAPDTSEFPSLQWTGSVYAAAWEDSRDGRWEIYFARLSSDGVKIGDDVRITNAFEEARRPSLQWTGTEFGAAWSDLRDGNFEIYFARISPEGVKIDDDIRITNAADYSFFPLLQWTGTEFGMVWEDNRSGKGDMYFTRISSSGSMVGSESRITDAYVRSPPNSIQWTGSEYGVTWYDGIEGDEEIYFGRISPVGARISGDVRITNYTGTSVGASLQWTGSEYGIAWTDDRSGNSEIYFTRVTETGSIIGGDVQVTNTAKRSWYPSLRWTGFDYGITWSNGQDVDFDVYFSIISATGSTIGNAYKITDYPGYKAFTSLQWTGEEFSAVWEDYRDGNLEIYFARIGCLP
jgi:hypothetical protein